MNDLIDRREAIAALGERPMSWTDSDYELGSRNRFDMDRLAIDTVPSVDAVPVVYCKDCIHWDERKGEKYCEEMYFNQDDPKFYCGYAERRENAVD